MKDFSVIVDGQGYEKAKSLVSDNWALDASLELAQRGYVNYYGKLEHNALADKYKHGVALLKKHDVIVQSEIDCHSSLKKLSVDLCGLTKELIEYVEVEVIPSIEELWLDQGVISNRKGFLPVITSNVTSLISYINIIIDSIEKEEEDKVSWTDYFSSAFIYLTSFVNKSDLTLRILSLIDEMDKIYVKFKKHLSEIDVLRVQIEKHFGVDPEEADSSLAQWYEKLKHYGDISEEHALFYKSLVEKGFSLKDHSVCGDLCELLYVNDIEFKVWLDDDTILEGQSAINFIIGDRL